MANENLNENLKQLTSISDWFDDQEEIDVEETDTASVMSVIEIPANIDFKLESSLDHILYDKMDISDLTGTFLIKDKKVVMDNLKMTLLDGYFGVDGEYNTQNMEAPSVNMGLDIRDIEIESAVNSFSMIGKIAPILKDCKGKVSIKFDYTSLIDSTMSPVLNSIEGYGKLQSGNIQVVSSKAFDKLADLLNLGDKFNNSFDDINISFRITNGRIIVEPFDANIDDIKMVVGGSHGIDQTLDYDLALTVPRKYIGSAANDVIDGLLSEAASKGLKINASENIKVKAKVVGTSTDPKITLNMKDGASDAKESMKEELKKKAQEELDKQKKELEDKTRKELEEQAQKVIDDAEKESAKIKREAREAADKALTEGNKEADALVKKASKEGMLAKIAAEKTADELKKKSKKKADGLIKTADKKADGIVAAARVKADKIRKGQ